jgi:hypothetical protein
MSVQRIAQAHDSAIDQILAPIAQSFGRLVNVAFTPQLPDVGTLIDAFVRGQCDPVYFKGVTERHGWDFGGIRYDHLRYTKPKVKGIPLDYDINWMTLPKRGNTYTIKAAQEFPSLEQILRLWNREEVNSILAEQLIMSNGYADEGIRGALSSLRFEIPGMGDLIRYAVRHAWDVDIIKHFDYLAELPMTARKWAARQGYGGPTETQYPGGKDNEGKDFPAGEAKWFDMEWVAHWILPSVGQGYEMLHRLYGDSRYGRSPFLQPNTDFTQADQRLLMRANDIPPYWRDRLIAISYNPYSRIDIRRIFNEYLVKKEDVYHNYRNMGYDDEHANVLANYVEIARTDKENAEKLKVLKPQVCEAVQVGYINTTDAKNMLVPYLKNPNDVDAIIEGCVLKGKVQVLKREISALRRKVMRGIITVDTARQELNALGIVPEKISEFIDELLIELEDRVKEVSASQLVQWAKVGIIDAATLFERLINLGYSRGDASNIVRLAMYEVTLKQQKAALSQIQKLQKQAEKSAADVAKAQARTAKARTTQAKIRSGGFTEKNLRSWVVNGRLNRNQAEGFLSIKGWNDAAIKLWLDELYSEIESGKVQTTEQSKAETGLEG